VARAADSGPGPGAATTKSNWLNGGDGGYFERGVVHPHERESAIRYFSKE